MSAELFHADGWTEPHDEASSRFSHFFHQDTMLMFVSRLFTAHTSRCCNEMTCGPPARIFTAISIDAITSLACALPVCGGCLVDLAMGLCSFEMSYYVDLYVYPRQEHFHVSVHGRRGTKCDSSR